MAFEIQIEASYVTKTPGGNYTRPEILLIKNRHETNLNFGSHVLAEIINEARTSNPKINTYVIRIADTTEDDK